MPAKLTCVQPVLMTRDVARSIEFYARLGFEVTFRDHPTDTKYAGIRRDGVELHLQWHDAASWEHPTDRPTYRFVVAEVDELFREFQAAGVLGEGVRLFDTSWGTREFHVQDGDGNGLQFYRDR